MTINQNGKLKVATANSIYHLGEAASDGSRTVACDGRRLEFERGILLGPCTLSFLGADVQDGETELVVGRGMAIMPVPRREDARAWGTSQIKMIENE